MWTEPASHGRGAQDDGSAPGRQGRHRHVGANCAAVGTHVDAEPASFESPRGHEQLGFELAGEFVIPEGGDAGPQAVQMPIDSERAPAPDENRLEYAGARIGARDRPRRDADGQRRSNDGLTRRCQPSADSA